MKISLYINGALTSLRVFEQGMRDGLTMLGMYGSEAQGVFDRCMNVDNESVREWALPDGYEIVFSE